MLICLAEINCPFGILRLISYIFTAAKVLNRLKKNIKHLGNVFVLFLLDSGLYFDHLL